MKIFIYIAISINCIYSSSLSLNGFGGQNIKIDAAASGLGHSILFSGRPNGVVHSAMSSQNNSSLAKIYVSNSYNQLSILNTTYADHHISSIEFSFPFRQLHHISIGLSPKTRSDFIIYSPKFEFIPGSESLDPYAIKHSYEFSGGISNLYIGVSSGHLEKFDFGFKWDILFGNLFSDKITNTYMFNYDVDDCIQGSDESYANDLCIDPNPHSSAITNNIYNFNGHSFTVDGRSEFNLHEIAASISINGPLIVNQSIINDSFLGLETTESINRFSISSYTCGYKFESLNGVGSTVEINKNFTSYDLQIQPLFETKDPNSISLHGGTFKSFKNSRTGFWNFIILRGGFMLKKINFNEYSVQDNAFTFGLGLNFLNNKNEVDISVSSGIRKTDKKIYPDEKYMDVNFGISSGDIWFKKLRRK